MSQRSRGIALIVVQLLLISSIAGKYLYERITRPRVWARAAQYDPDLPIRGRYLALSPEVDACGLPQPEAESGFDEETKKQMSYPSSEWRVRTFAEGGKLVVREARDVLPRTETQFIDSWNARNAQDLAVSSCDRVPLRPPVLFFIPDTAKSPFPLNKGEELWVEVTVPPAGPPRPIQLAVSENGTWKPLKFE